MLYILYNYVRITYDILYNYSVVLIDNNDKAAAIPKYQLVYSGIKKE